MNRKSNLKLLILFLHIIIANTFMLHAQINANLPVGAIPGAIDVSPMGAATYTIPIEVVSGTQGMQPNLSIVYNSMGGMGLLGMKWNLAGLSAITRSGQLPYYNGHLTSIQFNSKDRFNLDGNRLCNIEGGTYGAVGTKYAMEVEDFTLFVSNGGSLGLPNYFTAYTDNGSIVDYGYTSDSRQTLATDKVLSWYINKITDANGNYMTYHYGYAKGEIWINEIKYTGNTGLTPYAKVIFSYDTIPSVLGKNTYFVGGYGVPQTKYITSITVSYNNSNVRKYQFNYNLDVTGERTLHLQEVLLYNFDETQQFNSTKIIWSARKNNIEESTPGGVVSGKIVTGDFNGDGYADCVVYNRDYGASKYWQLYYNNKINGFYPHSTYKIGLPAQAYNCDFDGDGRDELVLAELVGDNDKYCICVWHFDNDVWVKDQWQMTVNNFHQLHLGDFTGEGKINIMSVSKVKEKKKYKYTFSFSTNGNLTNTPFTLYDVDEIRVIDYNGDGKSNIQITIEDSTYVYEYSPNDNEFKILFGDGFPTKWHQFFQGDFNGDGITDIITYYQGVWTLSYGLGNGKYTWPGQTLSFLDNAIVFDCELGKHVSEYPLYIADLNGDGKDDFVQVYYDYNPDVRTTKFKVYYSKGCVNNNYTYTTENITLNGNYTRKSHCYSGSNELWHTPAKFINWHLGDFNGDGKTDLLVRKADTCTISSILHFKKNEQYEFVKEIKDGLDNKTTFTYTPQYLSTITSNFFRNKKALLFLTSEIQTSNGIGGMNKLQFSYHVPVYGEKRRTFLGFWRFTTTYIDGNVVTTDTLNFRPENYPNINDTKEMLLPVSKIHAKNIYPYTINRTGYSYQRVLLPYNRVIIHNHFTRNQDFLSDTKTENTTTLENGRIKTSTTKTYNTSDLFSNTWLHSKTQTYTYQTITLNGNQTKTVPTKVLTTQQYGAPGTIIADTVTYVYYPTSEKGRLKWQRQGNLDGSITTSYEYLSPIGVCTLKTVSAAGCTPRTEKYEYDATRRFVTKITNPLNHSAISTYNAKTGNKLTETDANGLTTNYIYDKYNRLTKINHPDGTFTKDTIYWHSGSIPPNAKYCTKTTSAGRPDLIAYHDILGREVCRLDDGNYYDTRYNNKGQITQTSYPYTNLTDPDNTKDWSKFEYDNFGRKNKEIAPYCSLSYSYNNRKITVTDHLRENISTWKDYDALGRITQAEDPGGIINYNYTVNLNKRHITTIESNGATTIIETDLWGNRLKITEPNAGVVKSEYNKFNELVKQIDARGDTTTYQYDILGRVTQKRFATSDYPTAPQTIIYSYDYSSSGNKGNGKLYVIKINNTTSETFLYDNLSRLASHTKNVNGSQTFKYTYNSNGQLQKLTYPDNFAVTYSYTPTGKLEEIRNSTSNALIYKVNSRNKFNQPIHCEYGNGVVTEYSYNDVGFITRINTGNKVIKYDLIEEREGTRGIWSYVPDSTILNYRYNYDTRGLINSRSERIINRLETFAYDNLDRLTKITAGQIGQTGVAQNFYYHNNGNIATNSQLGTYNYLSTKPHAVTQIEPINNRVISENQCLVTYNFFNQPTKITESNYELTISYGANQQRNQTIIKQNNTTLSNRYYVSKQYEIEKTTLLSSNNYSYIYADNGVVALHIGTNQTMLKDTLKGREDGFESGDTLRNTSIDSIYYIHTDHLGSYCAITNSAKQVRQRNFFDPWGNNIGAVNYSLTRRGFTGHEHYPELKIINMNGRLYDPVIARFFSPDKYVANSSFTQDFNRYSYARNNPLMYTDPSGDFLITFLVNASIAWAKGENGWKAGGKAIANHFKIIGGLFISDKNRTGGGKFWEVVSRHTWQSPQTVVGLLYSLFANMCGQIDNVSYKAGATVMSGNFWGTGEAVTMGSYIHGTSNLEPEFNNWLFQHEYGHYLQSQAVGPFYFQRYGLPSAFSKGIHDFHPAEQDANRRALKYFNKHFDDFADNGSWDFGYNPIIGYDNSLPFDHNNNQLALDYAKLQPAWHDWVLGPNVIISMFINWPVQNSEKRYLKKLQEMELLGLPISWRAWNRF